MNRYLLLISIFLLSCGREKSIGEAPANSRVITMPLIDSLGTVSFSLPSRYDTGVSWIDYSDCPSCGDQYYRFQPRQLRITKERGFMALVDEPRDSVERFSITHSVYMRRRYDEDTVCNMLNAAGYYKRKEHLLATDRYTSVRDTLEKIGDRCFLIIVLQRNDSVHLRKVLGLTRINDNLLEFEYRLLTRNEDSVAVNFIKNATALIRTIRITPGDKWMHREEDGMLSLDSMDRNWSWRDNIFK